VRRTKKNFLKPLPITIKNPITKKMEHDYDDDPELVEDNGDNQDMVENLFTDDMIDYEEDEQLNEFSNHLTSLSQEDLMIQFKTWKARLKETAEKIATSQFENLGELLQEFDEKALRVQMIQSIYYDNFDKEIY